MPNIILSPAPFVAPKPLELPEGLSLNQIATFAYNDAGIPQLCREHEIVIEVDGVYIPKCDWHLTPAKGSTVNLYMPVRGGGKSPLRILLTIAVVAISVVTMQPEFAAAYLAGSAMAGAAVTLAVGTAGMMLVNAIAPIRPPGGKSGAPKDTPAYSISGARNQIAPYQPVPVILGSHRFFPPMAAKPYTELVGQDEYIRILLAWCGPCKIEDIRIGNTPINSYPGFTADGGSAIETREGWATDDPITLMPSVVNQTRVDTKLTSAGSWVDRTMAAGYDELSVEISFPQGLVKFDKTGKRKSTTVEWKIRYREVGAPSWIYLDGNISFPFASRAINTMSNGNWVVRALLGGQIELSQAGLNRPGTVAIAQFTVTYGLISDLINFAIAGKVGMVVSQNGANMQITAGSVKFPQTDFTVTGKTTSLVRRAYYGKVDRTKSYEVGLLRVTPDSTDERISDEVFWTIFRGTKHESPLNFPVPMAQIALRIKASEGAQNQIDIINCLASSYAPRFVAGAWEASATQVSSNPAALFRGVLQHPANKMPRSTAQIDDVTLGAWYDLCELEGYSFNQVREFTSSVWDCLADIAFAGRAAPALPYGKWSVDYDQAVRTVKGHVTPRNSWGFKAEKQLINRPHAFKIIFNNEVKDFLEDEIIVYDDGYSAANATVIERLEFKGITESNLAWRFGRYHIAQARLRPEVYTVFMDFEHLTFRRNDLIMVSHDVPRWGDHWGRVKSIITSGANTIGVVIDEKVLMDIAETYAVRFRLKDGSSLVMSVTNTGTETDTLNFTGSVPTVDGPEVDDLCMFNISTSTAVELICLGVRRQHDMVAEVTFVDHAPAVYDADSGAIPPFNSNINGRLFPMFLATPVIETARGELYTEDFISGRLRQRIIITGSLPTENVALSNREVVIRYRLKDSLEPWAEVIFSKEPIAFDVPSEGIYEVIAKQKGILQGLMGYYGIVESLWTAITEVTVQAVIDIGLPAPTNIIGFYEMDAQGRVSRVKLRLDVDISQTVPHAVAMMVSVQAEPRELDVQDFGTYLKVTDANVLNTGVFTILAGSTSSNVVIATNSNPLPDIDLSGFFWGSLNGVEFRKATGSTRTSVEFAEPFSTNPVPGNNLTWIELAWADERQPDFKLFNLVAANGATEVAKWSAINFTSGEYRITVDRAEEGTSQVTATKAQYYPAPGAGTETIMIPASHFNEITTNSFEGSADAQIVIPPGSWAAVTIATYVIDGLRVIRSPIVPIIDWRPL